MSDGGSSFPNDGINRFVNEKSIINKIEFHSVAFGSGANTSIL